MPPRILELRKKVLKKNDELARELRQRFVETDVTVINLVSSPGAGKTTLLFRILTALQQADFQSLAVVGDLATDNDARQLARSGVPVRQITTDGFCHLEADMVAAHIHDWDLASNDFLFIENVGNLVCPATYDLGESLRVVLHSVPEGEDKPLKYPKLFNTADVAVITKIDLAQVCEFDPQTVRENIQSVRPGMRVFELSAKTGDGMHQWLEFLKEFRTTTQTESEIRIPESETNSSATNGRKK